MSKRKTQKRKLVTVAMYKQLFNSPEGKVVLLDLMRVHYMITSTFDSDPALAAMREGERNVVLRILAMMKVDTAELFKQIEEAEKELNEES